jgi:biopolymer transport protein ExbB/TolQ
MWRESMDFFTGNSLWHLVVQSDQISKFVLLVLLGMSILCWTVFLSKCIVIYIKKQQLRSAHREMSVNLSVHELLALTKRHSDTLAGYFLSKNLIFFNLLVKSNKNVYLHEDECGMMLEHIDQTVDAFVEQEKQCLPLLSTVSGVAPLLGLFGTIWGLIHAFMHISEKQIADIVTVAPGIAEALITTLAGLLVAIPALIMFNYLHVQVKSFEQLLVALAQKMGGIMQQLSLQRMDHAQNETTTPRAGDVNRHFPHSPH